MNDRNNGLAVVDEMPVLPSVHLGAVALASPEAVVRTATGLAKELARVIEDRVLYSNIQGKRFVRVEGWTTCAAMLGVIPREVSVQETGEGEFLALVELVRASDGMVLGRASAICGPDEREWAKRSRNARRSMAITRACGKACRLAFSWIIKLAGFEPTPAEEMGDEERDPPPAQRETAKQAPAPKPETDRAKLKQAVKQWSGVRAEDLPGAMRDTIKASGVPIAGKSVTDDEASKVLAWMNQNASLTFAQAIQGEATNGQ